MGDKATNKAMAIAYKYVCFQVFCIPTEDMSDPDAENLEGEIANPYQETKKTKGQNQKQSRMQRKRKLILIVMCESMQLCCRQSGQSRNVQV